MSPVELRLRAAALSIVNLLVPYGICGILFREFNPERWMTLEYVIFGAFLFAALLTTIVLTDH